MDLVSGDKSSPSMETLSQLASLSYSQHHSTRLPEQIREINMNPLNMNTVTTRNTHQLDANSILSRMVTAQANGGVENMPIRMTPIQDFRRSFDKSTNSSHVTSHELKKPAGQTSNESFNLANRTPSDPYQPRSIVGAPKINPMLKLMEERIAAAANLQKSGMQDEPIQVGPVSSRVQLEVPITTPEHQAALQASINKWAGIDSNVKAQSFHTLSALRSFHKDQVMPSVCENNTLNSSFRSSQPLALKQQKILELLLLEQKQADAQQHANHFTANVQTSRRTQHVAPDHQNPSSTREVPNSNIARCAVSLAEIDRLRRKNHAIQILQQQAFNEQQYLRQKSKAASVLASSSNLSLNTLPGSNDSLKNLKQHRGPYRKRCSEIFSDEEEASTCTTGSHTASNTSQTPSIQSHGSFSRKISRTSFLNCTTSMENLRINHGSGSRIMNTKNQSFSNGLNAAGSHKDVTVATTVPLNQNISLSRNNSLQSGLNITHAQSASNVSSLVKKGSSRKSAFIHTLLSAQNKDRPPSAKDESPKNNSPQSRSPSTGIDHNLSGKQHCSDKIIMSDLPDRIKYQNAESEAKPIDIVSQALKSRGISSNGTKPTFDMPDGFFVQNCENYCQEAVDAIRSNDIDALKKLFDAGTNLQCANKFGESLIHLACRRSHYDIVSFLVNEAGISFRVRDDFGRTPLHDACWRSELDYQLIDLLLEREPKLLMLSDKRGHSPLDYTRRGHWAELIPFLLERCDKFQPA